MDIERMLEKCQTQQWKIDDRQHPVWSKLLGKISNRITGDFPEELRQQLFTKEELATANAMSMDALADDALQAKHLH